MVHDLLRVLVAVAGRLARRDSSMFRAIRRFPFLCMLVASSAAAQSIDGDYSGRYLCARQWNTVELRISNSGGGQISGVFTAPTKDVRGNTSKSSYTLRGRYDETSGRFRLDPQAWIGRAPAGYVMVGLEGTFNPRTLKLNGRITNPACGAFDLAMSDAAGKGASRQPPAPPQSSPAARSPVAKPAPNDNPFSLPPERRPFPTDAAGETFEYLDAAMSDAKGTARESEPIDDVNEWLKNEKFSCLATTRVVWNGASGGAITHLISRERFVVECNGDCKGVRYLPKVAPGPGLLLHFGLSQPVPVLQIKTNWFSGENIPWVFTRPGNTEPAPDIYIHTWSRGTFDTGPGCKAPKTNNK